MERNDNLCVICCYSFPSSSSGLGEYSNGNVQLHLDATEVEVDTAIIFEGKEILEHNHRQQQSATSNEFMSVCREFYKEILKDFGRNKGKSYNKVLNEENSSSKNASKTLLSADSKRRWWVCNGCTAAMEKITRAKGTVAQTEIKVRKLQQTILNEMRKLQGELSIFYEEMGKFEDILKNSDEASLRNMKEVLHFRKLSLKAAKDVHSYQQELSTKLISKPDEKSSNPMPFSASTLLSSLEPFLKTESEAMPLDDSFILSDFQTGGNDDFPSQISVIITSVEDDIMNISNPTPNLKEENSELPKHIRRSSRAPRTRKAKEKRRKSLITSTSPKLSSSLSSHRSKERNRNNAKLSFSKDQGRNQRPLEFDFTGMSPFEKHIITNVNRMGKKFSWSIDDPRVLNPMRYDVATGLIGVGTFTGIKINAEENSLDCPQCDYRAKSRANNRAEVDIYSHVLGRHLQALNCPKCYKNFASFVAYKSHKRNHDNEEIMTCDICQKLLNNKWGMRLHKWTHLNNEEKAELTKNIAEGKLKDSNDHPIPPCNKEKKTPCPTCGKAFKTSHLKEHELTHSNSGASIYVCSVCGKNMTRGSLRYHRKYVCRDDAEENAMKGYTPPRLECKYCVEVHGYGKKTFKNKDMLRMHISRSHPDAKKQ